MFYIEGKRFAQVINASGCRSRYKEQLDQLVNEAKLTTIVTKTCTLFENLGNPEPNFKEINEHISINCLGMPNAGLKYYMNLLPYYYKQSITYIISMDASDWNDLKTMLLEYDAFINNMKYNLGIHNNIREFVEINVSCPNKLDIITGTTSRIIAYDPQLLATLLENITKLDLVNINIGLKLSPYLDKVLLEQIAQVIITYSNLIKYIVCSNSIPNGMLIDTTTLKPILSVKTGGISGTANRLISISNVYHFNNIFITTQNKHISIVIFGCGGIETINDIKEYFAAGAKAVQIGRKLYTDGADFIKPLLSKL